MNQALASISLCNDRPTATPFVHAARRGWLATSILAWIVCGGACASPSWHGAWQESLAALTEETPSEEAPAAELEPQRPSPSDVQPASFDQPTELAIEPIEVVEAEFPQSMSVDEILYFTLQRHPLLAARRHEIDVARGALIAAGELPNPQLVMDADSRVQGEGATDLSARLEFTIPTAGKRRYAQAAARAGIRSAEFALRAEADLVATEAADAALEVLYLQELAALQLDIEQLTRQAAEFQRHRWEQGAIAEIDSIGAEIDAADVESDRLESVTLLEAARLRLSLAMGLAHPRPLEVTGGLAVERVSAVPLEAVLQAARNVRPELARAEADVARSRYELALSKANSIPDFQIGPRYNETFEEGDDTAGIRFSTDLAIFHHNEGEICTSAATLRQFGAMLDVARITSLSDVASAFVQLAPLEERLEYFKHRVEPLIARSERAIQEAQAANVIEPAQLTQQMRNLAQMRRNHLELRYLHTRIRVRLELLLGGRLADLHAGAPLNEPETIPRPAADGPLTGVRSPSRHPDFRR